MTIQKKTKAWLILTPITLLILFMLFAYYGTYSDGVRSGVVIKVSSKGVIFKTIEGQLNLESFGAIKSNNSLAETFNFSVDKNNEELRKELKEVSLTGERINLYYKQKYIKLFWRGETTFFVYDVERSYKEDDLNKNKPF